MSDLSIDNSHLITAILRYLCDEKKLLTQAEVDDIVKLGETYREKAEAGFEEFQNTSPSERRKLYRHLSAVDELDSDS